LEESRRRLKVEGSRQVFVGPVLPADDELLHSEFRPVQPALRTDECLKVIFPCLDPQPSTFNHYFHPHLHHPSSQHHRIDRDPIEVVEAASGRPRGQGGGALF
jgi:hypothetical protein